MFPFFILAAAVAQLLGQTEDGAADGRQRSSPSCRPTSPTTLRDADQRSAEARTGPLLWFGAIVGLWTAASFIETIRDILRRAYGVKYLRAASGNIGWARSAIILGAVVLLMIAFALTVVLTLGAASWSSAGCPSAEGVGHALGTLPRRSRR